MTAMDDPSPFSIISMERSGSTLLRQILSSHIDGDPLPTHGGEYLSCKPRVYDWPQYTMEDTISRFENYKNLHHKPISKLIHKYTHDFILDWHVENTKVIILERKDPFDTLLSYLLAKNNQWFWSISENDNIKKPIIASQEDLDEWEYDFNQFNAFQNRIKYFKKLYYEDYLQDYSNALTLLGIREQPNITVATVILYRDDKKKYVQNIDYVLEWYNNLRVRNKDD